MSTDHSKETWVRVFEKDGEQAVLMKGVDDENDAAIDLCCLTKGGNYAKLTFSFQQHEVRDKEFVEMSEEEVWDEVAKLQKAGF